MRGQLPPFVTAVLVGTTDGLWSLPERRQKFAGERIDAIVGGWVLSEGGRLRQGRQSLEPGIAHRINCVLPGEGQLVLGTAAAGLYRLELATGKVDRDRRFDHAPGRGAWYTPWGGPPDVRSIDRGPDGTVYVNVHVGGVVRSSPTAPTWRDTMDIDADVHQVIAHPHRPGVALAATAIGLAVTFDGADTWEFRTDGLHGEYCRAVAVEGDRVLVSVATSFAGRKAAVYRTDLGGGPLLRCRQGLPEQFSTNVNTACLAAADGVAVIGDEAGVVYRSEDGGETWEVLAADLPEITCVALGS